MNKNLDIYSYLDEVKQSKADKSKDKTKSDFGGCDLGALLIERLFHRLLLDLNIIPYDEIIISNLPRIDPNYCRFIKNNDKVCVFFLLLSSLLSRISHSPLSSKSSPSIRRRRCTRSTSAICSFTLTWVHSHARGSSPLPCL
jgi:hypothetical protein